MAEMPEMKLQELTRLGARVRLTEIAEETIILKAFLAADRKPAPEERSAGHKAPRKRKRMNAQARKEVSERMKRYWERRRQERSADSGKRKGGKKR